MNKFLRIFFGLSLSLIFSIFQLTQSKIQQGVTMWVIFQDIYRLFFIFLFSIIMLFTKDIKKGESYPFYLLILAPLSDYLGILFLNWGFQVSPPFFIFFLNSLIYPMDTFYIKVSSDTPINFITVILFCLLVSLVFFNGFFFSNEKFSKKFFIGFQYIMLSNFFFLINIHSQYIVCNAIGMPNYYLRTVPITLFLGLIISIITDWKNRPTRNLIKIFYRDNIIFLLLCGISGAAFYMTGSAYIEKYSPIYFNIANLPSSSISGLINLLLGNHKETWKKSIIYLLVIIIGSIMLWV